MDKITADQIPNYGQEKKLLSLIGNKGFLLAYDYRTTGPQYLDCTYPQEWQDIYAQEFLVAQDPTVIQSMAVTGNYRWSEIKVPDYFRLFKRASDYDLRYGATLSRKEGVAGRSFLAVARNDRDITDEEMEVLSDKLDQFREYFREASPLTDDERTVLKLLSEDLSVDEVAEQLVVSKSTVNSWIRSLKKKMRCRKITSAIAVAVKRQWI